MAVLLTFALCPVATSPTKCSLLKAVSKRRLSEIGLHNCLCTDGNSNGIYCPSIMSSPAELSLPQASMQFLYELLQLGSTVGAAGQSPVGEPGQLERDPKCQAGQY